MVNEDGGQALEWAAQCSGGVLILGSIQEACGHGTMGHGLVMGLSMAD